MLTLPVHAPGARVNRLPDWLIEKLASPPAAGTGLHSWLFTTARHLHAHMPPEAAAAALSAATANAGRRVPVREIQDAIRNSKAVAWQPGTPKSASSFPARPKQIAPRPARAVSYDGELIRLQKDSYPVPSCRPSEWIDWLFPCAEWLCLARSQPSEARTRRREHWIAGAADSCSLIVPSPMTGPSGVNSSGGKSHRCLDNTGPRRWLVIEFDSGTLNEQAFLHSELRKGAANGWPTLRLVVHSGGKSLHGWYGPVSDELAASQLMRAALSIGADKATWNRCQLVRLPGGQRGDKVQLVIYFNPCNPI